MNQPSPVLEFKTWETIVHRSQSFQLAIVLLTTLLLAASLVHADYLWDQPLHHVPTVAAILLFYYWAKRGTWSNAAMVAMNAFFWLHILGARYIYSFVPYDDWCMFCFGQTLSERFAFERNHYDRLVHFAYGALATIPQVELLSRRWKLPRLTSHLFSFALVLAAGALYEILEGLLAVILAPDWAERYNGQQGDLWDAQKDMALAAAGALMASALMLAGSGLCSLRKTAKI
jgi:putative membrane protein